jgi:hypothetical protein
LYTNTAGKKVWEPGPLTRVLTGANPGQTAWGYDILLGFDASAVENYYWFDPQPELRSAPIPANKGDFVSVVMHEFGHGFGMTGYRDFPTGQILGNDAMLFDDRSYFGGNGNPIATDGSRNPMYFRGSYSASLYGSDLHLTNKSPDDPNYAQNYSHLSSCSNSADGLESTLMNGCVLPNATRMEITAFDAAVFADLGYPLVRPSGDYNSNHVIDTADYIVWRKSLGQTGVGLKADGNLNNQVDASDLTFWRSQYGKTAGSGTSLDSSDNTAVPEPHVGALIVALIGLSSARRSRSNFLAKAN